MHREALVTLVIPCYNVARYLSKFLDSLEHQAENLDLVTLIFVDDGSTDETVSVIAQWLESNPDKGRLLTQANGGAAAARNAGLRLVETPWVSFPDPDDVLAEGYLATVLEFLTSPRADGVVAATTNILFLSDSTGKISDTHPLRGKFAAGERVATLDDDLRLIQLSTATAFLRMDAVRSASVTFNPEIRPNFEDAEFLARLFLAQDQPGVAVLPGARYLYRRRADQSSLVQTSWANPVKYDAVLRRGVLGLLDSALAERGEVPRWLQYLAIYEIQFYLRNDEHTQSGTASLTAEVKARCVANIAAILEHIDLEVLESFDASAMQRWIRVALIARKTGSVPDEPVLVGPRDQARSLVRLRYEFCGTRPVERFTVDGATVSPVHAKDRALVHFDSVSYYERIVWLPDPGEIGVQLDGTTKSLLRAQWYRWRKPKRSPEVTAPRAPQSSTRPSRMTSLRRLRARVMRRARRYQPQLQDWLEKVVVGVVRRSGPLQKYEDAWILCDRDTQAQDNAEHLYRYLASQRPDVNAWFAVSKTSPDWDRLKREGFRLLDYGSRRHHIALLNASELVSSQIDHYIVSPLPSRWKQHKRWRFTFLQHGVTKDDLSRWLNSKDIALCITTTPEEHASMVADGTSYKLTTREVAMTGQPRHDRLVALAREVSGTLRRTIVFMPTWRRELMGSHVSGGNLRTLDESFWSSEYFLRWNELMGSDSLARMVNAAGVRLVLMPHPNLERYLSDVPLPPHIELASYAADDFQQVVANAGLVVTDYSSNAFEAAIAGRPVLYYQFDRDTFYAGGHVYRKGYFDYERDGFGPVETDLEGVLHRITDAITRGFRREDIYEQRALAAFVACDGHSSEKVVAAIEAGRVPCAEKQ
ncbi:CDP-glycerol glycerophosphotransferase family protein [Demequina sp. NBRC 110055]|uniref:CDP-glycerol glycerophosphotransferase family protein n=1 Tax=Demequina sp. NBRC 110055 TaxID=1570344 RepID=UPI00135640DC|nr:CDP-glycerol glycerophosphotransferase family protein [Demequina sp. NBRC 110055]